MQTNEAPRLLVVDDEPDMLRSLRRILRLDGYQVETATSIAELFARSNLDNFSAIILDRTLPDGTSDEVLPRLKERAPRAAVIMTTGYTDLDGTLIALRNGAEDYLIKPINPDALRATLRQIIEKQRLQAQLVERERLATIGLIAAKLAHEIGNPLNGMSISTQLLQQRLAKASVSDQQIHKLTRILSDEIARLTSLLQDFRSLSRREQFVFEPVAVAELVTDLVANEGANYTARGVEVHHTISIDLPLVHADRDKMRQVLLNLCKNAVEAMPEGGTLSLSADSAEEQLHIAVSDTGEGVPEDVDILEPFVTTKKEGTGLGLAIVQQIVAAHHGRLTYTSIPGRGTTFHLSLPLSPPKEDGQ